VPAYYDNNDQSSEEGYRPSVRIRFPTPMLLRIDQIANSGRFMDRSEAIHEPPAKPGAGGATAGISSGGRKESEQLSGVVDGYP